MNDGSTKIEVNGSREQNRQPAEICWPVPPMVGPTLAQNEIHLWCAQLDGFSNDIPELWEVLSDGERKRAESFQFQKHRDFHVIQWGLLRHLLSRYTAALPAKHEFERGSHGKPKLAAARGQKSSENLYLELLKNPLPDHAHTLSLARTGGEGWGEEAPEVSEKARLFFNMSRSTSIALYAFTNAVEVGVDIERIRPIDDLDNIARNFFAAREAAALRSLPRPKRLEAFFNCWTRKEAILKATGQGITGGIDGVEVSVVSNEPARVWSVNGNAEAARKWSLHSLEPANGYAAAVAYKGPELKTVCHGFSSLMDLGRPSSLSSYAANRDSSPSAESPGQNIGGLKPKPAVGLH